MQRRADRKNFALEEGASASNASVKIADIFKKPRIVDFNVFKIEYWTSLSNLVPSSCSPELLFSEIIGVIKGSSTCARSLKSLSREQYLCRASKASQSYSDEIDREKLYSAFERYEKLKK